MSRLRRSLSLAAVLGLLASGCGGDDDDGNAGGEGGGAGGGEAVEVNMEGTKYVPQDVTVPAGGTVKWNNTDTPTHTVTYEKGAGEKFDSGTMNPGDSFEQKFTAPGTVNYVCEIHPFQKGTVTVE